MRFKKKVLSGLLSGFMVFSLMGIIHANENPNGSVDIDKTATVLDENAESTVKLSIGSTENMEKVAVMFLLDKSTSQGMRDEAVEMLDELASKMNTDIIYDVVIFSGTATATGWQNIQDEVTLDDTKANFVNRETTSGTNMDAGIEKALSELSSLPAEYTEAAKYLVTLSDGITYVWTGEDGKVKTVPIQGLHDEDTVETSAQNGADTWAMMYEYGASLKDIYGGSNISETISHFNALIVDKMANTKNDGHIQDYYGAAALDNPISTYIYDDIKNQEVAEKYATNADFAMYESMEGYKQLVQQFDYSYAYAAPELTEDGADNLTNWDNYPWGYELMTYLQSISSNCDQSIEVSNADPSAVFAAIKDQILYTIQSGTVTDVMGKDVDFKGVETVQLTVGQELVTGVVEGNTVHFADDRYVVVYDPTTDSFTWDINVPVEEGQPLELSYVVQLVNPSTDPGLYTVPTNESAILEYTTTTGEQEKAVFPIPTVEYTVEKPVIEEPEEPSTPSEPETPVEEPNQPEEKPTDLVQTADQNMIGWYALALGIGTLGLIIALEKKKKYHRS